MALLADGISVRGRFARSANLERDRARPEPLDGYVLTARGADVVERIAAVAAGGPAGGAWSVTGPYGSGKSSLALLLDAAFGGRDEMQQQALSLIDAVSPATAERIRRAHERHGTAERGFCRALVTAAREPLTRTVARALRSAASQNAPTPPPRRIGPLTLMI